MAPWNGPNKDLSKEVHIHEVWRTISSPKHEITSIGDGVHNLKTIKTFVSENLSDHSGHGLAVQSTYSFWSATARL